jgi:hypothetical protein
LNKIACRLWTPVGRISGNPQGGATSDGSFRGSVGFSSTTDKDVKPRSYY